MKTKALSEPKQRKAFQDKYLAAVLAVAALLISSISSAQTDSLKYSQINGYGFKYKRMAFDSVLMIPLSTSPHAPYRMGALRYKAADSTLQLWTGHQWNSILTGVGNGIDTAYAYDDSTLAIETPNRDYFIKIKGKPSATQLNDSAFIVGDDTITIHGTTSQNLQAVTDVGNKTTDTIIAGGIRTQYILGDTLNQDDYEIDVFPDIQGYTGNSGTRVAPMDSMFNWVVRNRVTENIRAVIQVGDLTNQQADLTEMVRADTQFAKLRVLHIPHIPVIGNHDYSYTTWFRNDSGYNAYFGPSAYVGQSFYGGCMDGSNANFFILFEGGGHKYAAIGLEFMPRDTALNWAQKIIDSLSDREIIIVTHAYIARSGERSSDTTQFATLPEYFPSDANNGDQMWQKLIKKNKRIFLICSGHFVYGFGITPPVVKRINDAGTGGNVVYQTVCNYQQDTLSGNGYFMRMKFKPRQGKITVSFYSPYLGYYDARFPSYDLKYPAISIDGNVGVSDNGGGLNVAGEATFDSSVLVRSIPKNRLVYSGVNGKLDSIPFQSPNLVLAGPVSGSVANPTFRSLVVNDIPLDSNKNILNQNTYPQTANFWTKGMGVISGTGAFKQTADFGLASTMYITQSTNNTALSIQRAQTGNNPPALTFYHTRNSDINTRIPASNGDFIGGIWWLANRKGDSAVIPAVGITSFIRNGSVSTGGEFAFWTIDSATGTLADRMHLTSTGFLRLGGSATTQYMLHLQSGDAFFAGNTYHIGNVGIGTTSPTARLHLPAGTASANTAPLKLTAGTSLTTPEDGAFEYNGTHFYGTVGSTRYQLDQQSAITSINSQTGPAITLSGGVGTYTSAPSSNTIAYNIDPTSSIFTRTLKDFYVDANNSGTSATDLYADTLAGNILNNDGDKLKFEVGGDFNDATATCKLDFDFGGNAAGSTGTLTISATGSWKAECLLIRTGSSTARVITTFLTPGATVVNEESRVNITGLNWANSIIFKIYGTAGGAGGGSNDITAGLGTLIFIPKVQ